MSSPRPETDARPAAPAEEPKKAQLSAVQVAASALAAVSSAVVASFFGVAGTLIGAALASVITTVSAALYSTSLSKTNERLRQTLSGRQKAADREATGEAPPATQTLPAHLDPRRAPARRFRPRWSRVAVYAVAVFVLAMGIVTGIELIGQKPVSALVTNSHSSGTTTLGELATASSSDTTPSTPSSPTTTAPATTTAENSPADPTGSADEESGSASPSTSSSAAPSSSSSPSRSSASSTAPQRSSSPPAPGAAATATP